MLKPMDPEQLCHLSFLTFLIRVVSILPYIGCLNQRLSESITNAAAGLMLLRGCGTALRSGRLD